MRSLDVLIAVALIGLGVAIGMSFDGCVRADVLVIVNDSVTDVSVD